MRSALRLTGLLAATALACIPAAAAADENVKLAPTAGTRFPDRAYVLTLPAAASLGGRSIRVYENGDRVSKFTIVPANASAEGQFGMVLAIDASKSMRGDPIERAVEAARAFSERRSANQLMGVVTFNRSAKVVLPLTTDQGSIEAALAEEPQLSGGTHIYDGVQLAVSMLRERKVAVGSIVLLSDGADTGSLRSIEDVVAGAEQARVRVFSVGLRSSSFDAAALSRLARKGHGTFTEATSPDDLGPIFDQLGTRLASEYLIRYRSAAGPNKKVVVAVKVVGVTGVATVGYVTPSAALNPVPPYHRPFVERFVRSAGGMLVAGVVPALLVAGAVLLLLRPKRPALRRRMAEFISLVEARDGKGGSGRRDQFLNRAERSFEKTRWWARFKEELEIAEIGIPAVQIAVWTGLGTLLAMWVFALIGGGPAFGLFGLIVPLGVRAIIKRRAARQRRLFADQLPDNLQVLSAALRAGHSLVGALSVVVDDSPEPSRREFRRVVADEQLGVPLEEALGVVVRRMDNDDLGQVALVASLQRETGGNTAEVLDRVAETVRERFELRRLVRTLTAQGRMSRWVLSFLPVGLLGLITLINPNYMQPLFSNTAGRVLLVIATVMIVSGSLVIRRIVDIKV
jgi:tight adherence protein B